jgi:hypothetical protein
MQPRTMQRQSWDSKRMQEVWMQLVQESLLLLQQHDILVYIGQNYVAS